MQLTYNNQSLLGSGCYEAEDSGITRMGREVIAEMNRVGMAIDMSHSGERSTLEAIDLSARPIAITHANPASWHKVPRNKSDARAEGAGGARRDARPVALSRIICKGGSELHARGLHEHGGAPRRPDRRRPHRHRLRPLPGPARQRRRLDAQRPLDQERRQASGSAPRCFRRSPPGSTTTATSARSGRACCRRASRPATPPRSWAATGIGSTPTRFTPRGSRLRPARRVQARSRETT